MSQPPSNNFAAGEINNEVIDMETSSDGGDNQQETVDIADSNESEYFIYDV